MLIPVNVDPRRGKIKNKNALLTRHAGSGKVIAEHEGNPLAGQV